MRGYEQMVTGGRVTRKFKILLHEGNVEGFTEKVINGTALEAKRAKQQMEEGLSEEQRVAGWWYEIEEEPSEPVPPHPTDRQRGSRRRRRDNSRH